MPVGIRAAVPSDAEAVCALHIRSIRVLCASAYDPAQIDAWVGGRQPTDYRGPIGATCFLVAESEGQLRGFAMLNPGSGELHALYVDPASAGSGVGTALLTEAEDAATRAGAEQIGLNATLNAVPFYQRRGYRTLGPSTNVLPNGVALSCVRMEKTLPPPSGAPAVAEPPAPR